MSDKHNLKIAPDQTDTSKFGVRKYCSQCHLYITEFNPLLHTLLRHKHRQTLEQSNKEEEK